MEEIGQLMSAPGELQISSQVDATEYLYTIYLHRFRTLATRLIPQILLNPTGHPRSCSVTQRGSYSACMVLTGLQPMTFIFQPQRATNEQSRSSHWLRHFQRGYQSAGSRFTAGTKACLVTGRQRWAEG